MRFLDLFSGIGGFRLGLEMAGHECVGHVEIDKYANQSYRAIHQPKEREFFHEDITTITDEFIRELRDRGIDIIAGGFPCQAFSIAGKRAGFEDTRGTLFFDIARIAKEIKPKYLFLENVKGLLNHDRGGTFEVILRTLDEIGYDAEWQVLNSKHFGVPQNRERVFIIGHLRGSGGRKVFPIGGTDKPIDTEYKRVNSNMVLCKLEKPYINGKFASMIGDDVTIRDIGCEIAGTVTARYHKGLGANSDNAVIEINQIGNLIDTDSFGGNPQVGRVYGTDGISPCLNTMGGGGREPKVAIPVLTPDRAEKRQNGRRFKEDGEPMFTLTAQDRHGIMVTRNEIKRKTEISHCLMARDYKGIGNQEMTPVLEIKEATKKGYAIAEPGDSINLEQPNSKTRRGRVGKGVANTITTSCNQAVIDQRYIDGMSDEYSFAKKKAQAMLNEKGELPKRFNPYNSQEVEEVSPTLTASCGRSGSSSTVLMKQPNFRIRKLTPKECWRLQGIPDHYFDKASAVNSDSQLYKQAGNACTVNVMYEIAKRMGFDYLRKTKHK